ncbi:MAG: ribbon-helix-helix domain-containing protein [Alphaproteobacteria bacterium]|nr:ribbon-helix-helix domain-containing protein [Alphaproteobacteria bacterium]
MTETQTPFLSPARHRVLQVEGRRYSVRLEEAYWRVLARIARDRNMRMAEIIDEVAAEAEGEASLASALRLRCIAALEEELGRAITARGGRDAAGGRYGASLENLIDANPAPSLLLSHDGKILLANAAFQKWSGVQAEALLGQPYDWFFQLRMSLGLEEAVARLAEGKDGFLPARISYIAPGRVVVANGLVCLGHYGGLRDYTWIVMIGGPEGGAAAGSR